MSEDTERLAKALIELREAEGLSVTELALRTTLSVATIKVHESDLGRLPTSFAARRFEEVLDWAPGSIPTLPQEPTDPESPPDSSAVTG